MDRLVAANELPFRVSFTGHSGHLRVEPLPPVERPNPLRSLPDLILPPAFEPDTPDSILKNVENKYLMPDLDVEEFNPDKCGRQWEFDWFNNAIVHLEPSAPRLTIIPVWEPPYRRACKEEPGNKEELMLPQNANDKSSSNWIPKSLQIEVRDIERTQDSSSVLRRPGAPEDFVRGNTNSRPFLPGGFEETQTSERYLPEGASNGDWVHEIIEGGCMQTIPPGFKHGLDLGTPKAYSQSRINVDEHRPQIADFSKNKRDGLSVQFDDLFKKAWEENVPVEESDEENSLGAEDINPEGREPDSMDINPEGREPDNMDDEVHDIALDETTVLDEILSSTQQDIKKEESYGKAEQKKEVWAVMGGDGDIAGRFSELVPDMALNFPFELDKFQKEAVYYIERGDSVFVAAHTSAGKTVVAEYAFALAAKHCTRAVYTSPIKTISNQKYRDFSEKFDVGLLTGDVSLRPEASCLIMTTEILRSMLYKGADIIRDIEWVIFDEVHYVNDVERGVVWEEVIIMLPRHINIVLLSATVPNRLEFADWIGRTKKKKIYVTGTTQRPVPLEHYLYYSGELHKICEREMFLPHGVKAAKEAYVKKNSKAGSAPVKATGTANRAGVPHGRIGEKGGGYQAQKFVQSHVAGNASGGGTQRRSETTQLFSLVNKLSQMNLLPAVVFCFSKNRCDQSADSLNSVDLTSGSEKSEIHVFCEKAFSRLKGSDRQLPQVLRLKELLRRGIGVHHAGLLPIVKEVVEMLFCRGVIKVLFSTETFAMGVNAPAKTVAFHTVRKFDGKSFRQLLPGEYTQMAGRAGRRGLDEVGIVILICWDEVPEESDLKHLITGKPTKLESQFRLTYSMILNLLRVEDLKVEDMLKRSFAEFHAQQALYEQQKQLQKGEGELSKMRAAIDCIRGDPTIEEYYEMQREAEKLGGEIQETVMQSRAALQALTPGRLVVVRTPLISLISLGVVLKPPSTGNKNSIVLVLNQDPAFSVPDKEVTNNKLEIKGANKLSEGYYRKGNRDLEDEYFAFGGSSRKGTGAVNVSLPHYGKAAGTGYVVTEIDNMGFISICKNKIRVDNVRLLEDVSATAYSKTVQELLQQERENPKNYPPALDPFKDIKLKDPEIVDGYRKRETLLQKMAQNQCHGCPKLQENYEMIHKQQILKEKIKKLKYEMSDAALQQMPDFEQRIQVLQEVGCIDFDLVVQLKGRVACEINSGDELVATEMLFENHLDELEPAEAVAIMSALIFQQKDTSEPCLTPKLKMAKERLFNTALRLGNTQAYYGLPVNPQDYAKDSLKFGLVEVVYEWAKGTPFADICFLTDVPEGSIVRTIVRLDETCREFKNAARIMGNSSLYEKMEVASDAIKRDIVFAASLYVTGVTS
ncbi:hypothetical protein SUGI_0885500 [Cryptomeria japonica]|uniref:DExH-box ATP-dependent RNA helicase DExH11 isoform X2 n=1 Tax=Cryptomeria japonica TaxID=3369 RepID=UPI00241489F7|nr:DExH-box ATP-dependent RNA helicase DExH11 isoform X2 [Cryptomeria japonica]GLJ42713.1 hypothetical protein SUGI_0885500 [Cryptomeria japonica]